MRRSFPTALGAAVLLISVLATSSSAARAPAAQATPSPTTAPASTAAPAPSAPSAWITRIDRLIGAKDFSVAVGVDGRWIYRHDAGTKRAPASNEKLLLSLALLDELGPSHRMPIRVIADAAPDPDGVLTGPIWITGSGDPEVGADDIRDLGRELRDAGVSQVQGRIFGAIAPFAHDWMAPGWKSYFPSTYVALPTALTYEGNVINGRHIDDPELEAAQELTKFLRSIEIGVTGKPGSSSPPTGLEEIAEADSAALEVVMRHMNFASSNFHAETLGKMLGWLTSGQTGTIAAAATAIEGFASDAAGVEVIAHDSSGLSYKNRVAPEGMVQLLWFAEDQPWVDDLRQTLPEPGEGTLGSRLGGVEVRAKTGTLTQISALSGWVWLEQSGQWAAFSIISKGTSKDVAVKIEDGIVRTLSQDAAA